MARKMDGQSAKSKPQDIEVSSQEKLMRLFYLGEEKIRERNELCTAVIERDPKIIKKEDRKRFELA